MNGLLEVFNRKTHWNKRGKPPVLRICTDGRIRFSVEAMRILGLELGDKISFMVDNRDMGIFYFYKDDKDGLPLKFCTRGKDGVAGLQICCRPLGKKLLDYFGYKEPKTFDMTSEKTSTPKGEAWFVLKENVHRPIKWRKINVN